MPTPCLFCDNRAGNREHLWPAWIHKRKDFGPIRHQIGAAPAKILTDPQQKVRTVCSVCNNGWMHDLEDENIPLIGCTFQDISTPLDEMQQQSVSVWTVKTAMVFDSIKGRESGKRFYRRADCVNMRISRTVPDRTRIWLGRYSVSSLGVFGTDLQIVSPIDGSHLATGIAVTIIIGHLALQILSTRIELGHTEAEVSVLQVKPGDWQNMLVPIWPFERPSVMWPPKITFTNSGPHSIASLMDRCKIGKRIT